MLRASKDVNCVCLLQRQRSRQLQQACHMSVAADLNFFACNARVQNAVEQFCNCCVFAAVADGWVTVT
jgi:hypothetical protein